MKVRITKCSRENWWYERKIGETFEVISDNEYYEDDDYPKPKLSYSTRFFDDEEGYETIGYILMEDCVIVKEQVQPSEYLQEMIQDWKKVSDELRIALNHSYGYSYICPNCKIRSVGSCNCVKNLADEILLQMEEEGII